MSAGARRWRHLAALAAAAAALALAAEATVAVRAYRRVEAYRHPPRRLPVQRAGQGPLAGFQDLALRSADGVPLAAWWCPPRNGAAVVLVHGVGANREQLLPQALELARRGYGVLLLDLRGHGQSGGDGSTLGVDERLDVAAALAHAAAAPGVRPGAVAAVGFSIGGFAVAGAALQDRRVGAVVLEAVHPSLSAMLREEFGAHGPLSAVPAVWAARLQGIDLGAARPIDALCRRRARPLLLVYGGADPDAIPRHGVELLRAACGDASLWIVPGGGHGGWEDVAPAALEHTLADFLDGALLGAGAPPPPPRGG